MTRPFGLSRRELLAWTVLVLGAPLLLWAFRTNGSRDDALRIVHPESEAMDTPVRARLDLNRASAEELQLLPGIGPERARQIVAYRQQYGRFRSERDLAQLPGFPPALVERIAPMLTVSSATPAEP